MKRSPLFWPSVVILIGIFGYAGAAVIPAIVPAAVPTANKTSTTGTVFALASSNALTPSAAVCTNANGDMTTTACTANAVTSTTPVTVNANSTADQQLMELSLTAGYLNSLGRPFDFFGAGVYTTQAAQTPTLEFKIKLCTVSGCGSGTVVSLVDITSGATTAGSTNISWNLRAVGTTAATGATGNLETHGNAHLDLGSALSTASTVYNDTNTAVSSNIDLTAALFVDFTIKFSTQPGTPFNAATQREGVVNPGGATAGGGGGALTQISKQTLGSPATTITFSSIPGTYNNLVLTILGRTDNAVTTQDLYLQANGDTGTNYDRQFFTAQNASTFQGQTLTTAQAPAFTLTGSSATANFPGINSLTILGYAQTTFYKMGIANGGIFYGGGNTMGTGVTTWDWRSTSAITSLTVGAIAGNMIAGTTAILYGQN